MRRGEDVSGTASLACGRREEGANGNSRVPGVMVARTFCIGAKSEFVLLQVTRHIGKTFPTLMVMPIV